MIFDWLRIENRQTQLKKNNCVSWNALIDLGKLIELLKEQLRIILRRNGRVVFKILFPINFKIGLGAFFVVVVVVAEEQHQFRSERFSTNFQKSDIGVYISPNFPNKVILYYIATSIQFKFNFLSFYLTLTSRGRVCVCKLFPRQRNNSSSNLQKQFLRSQ